MLPNTQKNTYFPDTTQKLNEFFAIIQKVEELWKQQRLEQSNAQLKRALHIGKYICQVGCNQHLKTTLVEKLLMLSNRYQQRQKIIVEKQNKPGIQSNYLVINPKSGDKDIEKLQNSLKEAIVCEKPNVSWDDVGGLEVAKTILQQAVCLPLKCPQIFEGILEPWKGILLYGPPGTGKTFLAKACASQANSTFFSVSASDLKSKYVGESQKLIKTLFQLARKKAPSIIFIDQIDSLCSAAGEQSSSNNVSKGIRGQFLKQMQGFQSNPADVLTLATTNFPWDLDQALLRRFQRRVYVSLPQKQTRYYIFKKKLQKNNHSLTHSDFEQLASRTEGYSGADVGVLLKASIYEIVRNMQKANKFRLLPSGKLIAVQDSQTGTDIINGNWKTVDSKNIQIAPLSVQNIYKAMIGTKATVDPIKLKSYQQWTQKVGTKS